MSDLTFAEYQQRAHATAVYPTEVALAYVTMGLVGEAGEIANKVKKIYRDHDGKLPDDAWQDLVDEIGDVLWYLAELCTVLQLQDRDGYDVLAFAAANNLLKLEDRAERGALHGSGDDR